MIRNLQRQLFTTRVNYYRCPLSKYQKICEETKKETREVDSKNEKEKVYQKYFFRFTLGVFGIVTSYVILKKLAIFGSFLHSPYSNKKK